MKLYATILTILFCCLSLGTAPMSAKCTGQDVPDCTCEILTAKNLTICIGGIDYNITMFSCEQLPNPNLISDPCSYPACTGPTEDRISWIKQICVPAGFPPFAPAVIYNAIICATDLCTNDYLGVSGAFPNCDVGTDACTTANGVYCHTIALPKCVEWDGLCLKTCNDECNQFCYVQRQYCIKGSNCEMCPLSICTDPNADECSGNCTEVDCRDLTWTGCCQ